MGDEERTSSIHLIAIEKKNRSTCAIGLDNQAAIEALPSANETGTSLNGRIRKNGYTHTGALKGSAQYKLTIHKVDSRARGN